MYGHYDRRQNYFTTITLLIRDRCDRVVKAYAYKSKVSHWCGFDSSRAEGPHVGKEFFLAVGPYWLARCQYNVTELHAVLIWHIVRQWTSTIKVAISVH